MHYDLGRTIPDRWRCLAEADGRRRVTVELARRAAARTCAHVHRLDRATQHPAARLGLRAVDEQQRMEYPTARRAGAGQDTRAGHTGNGARDRSLERRDDFLYLERCPLHAQTGLRLLCVWRILNFQPTGRGPIRRPCSTGCTQPACGSFSGRSRPSKSSTKHTPSMTPILPTRLSTAMCCARRDGSLYRNPAFWFHDALIPDFTQAASDRLVAAETRLPARPAWHRRFQNRRRRTSAGPRRACRRWTPRRRTGQRLSQPVRRRLPPVCPAPAPRRRRYLQPRRLYGGRRVPAHWAGDENSTWEAYRRSLHAGLSAALSGVLFWGWDIAGFSEALPSAELYLRATAMCRLLPDHAVPQRVPPARHPLQGPNALAYPGAQRRRARSAHLSLLCRGCACS